MNKSKLYLYIFYLLLAMGVLALASCASDDLAVDGGQKGSQMSLGIDVMQVTEGAKTRAAAPAIRNYQMKTTDGKPVYVQCSSEAFINKHNATSGKGEASRGVSITSDTFYDRFGLFYYQYDKGKSWASIVAEKAESPTVSNMAVEKSAGWLTDKYWPGADHKLTFMAYAPFDNDYKNGSSKYIQLATSVKGYPTLTYTVPAKVEDQKDLLVSAETATQDMVGDYNKVIGMKFYHTLSAINFKIGSTMAPGRISKIEIKGVYNKGAYDFGSKEWSDQSGSVNYTLTPNYVIGDQRGVVFTGVDDTKNDLFLLMPQTVPAGAKIVVTIQDGANYGSSHEMELPIEGHEWLPGYTITYSLSTSQENSDYIFSVSKIASIDKAATTVKYNVSSYVQSYYGSQTPVGWKAKYAVDEQIETEGDYSEELGDVVTGGFIFDMPSPTATTSAVTANIAALLPPVSDPSTNTHTATLRAASPKGTKGNPYDLSTLDGARSQSTANCYVVNAPGWYKVPIVYGNCIKNGTNNTAVYGTSTAMANFVNHLDKQITDPWLVNNADVLPSEAILVWQDAYNMIPSDSVGITSDKKYFYFKVNEDYICQGNALLSVRDDNKKILWSWHIWVTDEELSSATNVPITNQKKTVYNLMAVPLGHCNPDRRIYKPRELKFEFEQEESGMTAEVLFSQSTTSYLEYGLNVTYYQYGRSTPERFIGTGIAKTLKTLYGDEYPAVARNAAVTRGTAIQNPTTHYYVERGEWCSKRLQRNYWDVKNTINGLYDKATNPSVKTIYDPCPVGYKVPEPEVFTSFTTTGTNSTSKAAFNVFGAWNQGWTFYTEPNKQGSTYYLHAFCDISYTGSIYGSVGSMLRVRTTGSNEYNNLDCGIGLYFTSSTIENRNRSRRCTGLTIIPESDD